MRIRLACTSAAFVGVGEVVASMKQIATSNHPGSRVESSRDRGARATVAQQ